MRHLRHALIVVAACGLVPVALGASISQQHEHPTTPGAHHHPEAAKLKNPVAVNAESIAAGKQVYDKNCANCHGEKGMGDGKMGEQLNPKPSDLTDAAWKHGSTDGEMFTLIRDGAKNTGMKAYGKKLTPNELWSVVNYVRSLGPHPSH